MFSAKELGRIDVMLIYQHEIVFLCHFSVEKQVTIRYLCTQFELLRFSNSRYPKEEVSYLTIAKIQGRGTAM